MKPYCPCVGRLARSLVVLPLLISSIGLAIADDEPTPSPLPDDGSLESAGAVIGTITIHAASIFDVENPKEDKKALRAANKLHVKTRDRVILRQLTFVEGDRYSRAALDESERILRHNGYLYDAQIRATGFDGQRVEIGVWTRDVWTLRPAIGFHRSGGVNAIHFGIHDANFLGLGKDVEVERVNGVDRTQTLVEYQDPAFAGSHVRMSLGYSNNSDGSSGLVAVDRPFWRQDEPWGAGVRGETNDRTDSLYALGEITNQFQELRTFGEVYYGRRVGDATRTIPRLLSGYTYDRSLFSRVAVWDPASSVPPDRTLSYFWLGVSLFRDGFVRAHDMDKLGRTEDVNLGLDMTAKLGFASPAFGADRSAAVVDFRWHEGFNPGFGQIVTLDTKVGGRVATTGVEDGRIDVSMRYYHRDNDVRLFFMSLTGSAAANLDPDHQILLGGDNGLRGYPLRYALGDKSVLLTVEERFFLDREFLHVMRLGGAVFADVGKAWSEMPSPAAHLGVLKDVGFGLRFGQTRSAHAAMLRIDVAIPFDALAGGLHPQILVTTGETF